MTSHSVAHAEPIYIHIIQHLYEEEDTCRAYIYTYHAADEAYEEEDTCSYTYIYISYSTCNNLTLSYHSSIKLNPKP
jgi:hypothetical protein